MRERAREACRGVAAEVDVGAGDGDGGGSSDDGSNGAGDGVGDGDGLGCDGVPHNPFEIAKRRVAVTHRVLRLYNSVRELSNAVGALL